MHFETLAPLMPALIAALMLSPIIAIIAMISRHRLAARHRELKRTLNRVSGERDKARFALLDAAKEFDDLDRIRSLDTSQSGVNAAKRARGFAERCRDAAGQIREA